MFSKFSVQKPLTIFVSVLMVIILGCVSFSNMTPDLLPSINLPYAMVVTVYAGATPEEVEDEITKPLERSMASLEDINNVSSTSAENVSTIVLEFNEDADTGNMVSAIREKINLSSDDWGDMVSTPYIIEINPDLLPVGVYAVDYEGMDSVEVTEFLNNELISDLEGVSGVASIDLSGNIEEKVTVLLSQEKIDAVNKKIRESLEKSFAEGEKELTEQEDKLNEGKTEIENQELTLNSSKQELEYAQSTLVSETAKAQAELIDKKIEIEDTMVELNSQLATAEQTYKILSETVRILNDAKLKYDEAIAKIAELETQIAELENKESLTDEENLKLLELKTQRALLDTTLKTIEATLVPFNTTLEGLVESLEDAKASVAEIENGISQIKIAQAELKSASATITTAMEDLNKQQISGALNIANGLSQILDGQTALAGAMAQLDEAQVQIDTAKDQVETQKEDAFEAANLEITMDMINQLLVAQNFSMPAGYITEDGVDYLVRVGDKIESVEELQKLAIMNVGMDDIDTILLSDVADVYVEDNSDEMYATVNGGDALILSFSKQSSYATKTVSENLNETFKELEKEYDGLKFSKLSDQGDYIDIIVDTILESLILGAIFAIAILIFFLKDLRPTIIIACSIPISLMFAIVLMYFSGITLNIISLSGLAIGVGMLVDNSVVVIENIYRMRSEGMSPLKAAVQGASQVTGAIIASTLTTVCVFMPIVFIQGITRQLFTDMALTVGYSLMASLIVAITLVPAMASNMLKEEKKPKSFIIDKLTSGYEFLARKSIAHKWVVITLSLVLLITSTLAAVARGYIFMPTMSGTQITISVNASDDLTFEEKTLLADEISKRVSTIEEIETVGAMIAEDGNEGMLILMSSTADTADITMYAIMSNDSKRKDAAVCEDIVRLCEDLDCEVSASGSMDMGAMLTAMSGAGISVKIYGNDLDSLIEESQILVEKMSSVEGVTEVTTSLDDSNPEIRITVDKDKAIEHGLTVAQVYMAVAANVKTETPSDTLTVDSSSIDMVIYSEENMNTTFDDIKNMVIDYTSMTGEKGQVDLKDISKITETVSLNSISRENQRRVLTVSAEIDKNENVTLVTENVEEVLENYETIEGNTIKISGESETIMEAIVQLIYMLLLAVVIIYFIMVAQFQSFKSPFIVMFTIPLAFTGGFMGLLLTGKEISVISMVGFVMLAGIIVNNGIVLIDYINILRLEGMEKREAIVKAGVTRLRPILMTSLTTVLGLVFVALGNGFGSEMMQPVAIVCIGGLLYATLMTLFVVPAMYDILSRKKMEKRIVD